jgi:hypothetical protein
MDVMKKGRTILKSKKMTSLKKYVIKHCEKMSKSLRISHTRGGKKRSHLAVWGDIMKKGSKSMVTKKRDNVKKTRSSSKIRKGRRRYTRKRNSFGSWWDNTQQLYGGPGARQAADASTLNGMYPFYDKDGWQPYYSIKGPSFGYHQVPRIEYSYPHYNQLDPVFDQYSVNLQVPQKGPVFPRYSSLGRFPQSVDSPYPFTMNRKRW